MSDNKWEESNYCTVKFQNHFLIFTRIFIEREREGADINVGSDEPALEWSPVSRKCVRDPHGWNWWDHPWTVPGLTRPYRRLQLGRTTSTGRMHGTRGLWMLLPARAKRERRIPGESGVSGNRCFANGKHRLRPKAVVNKVTMELSSTWAWSCRLLIEGLVSCLQGRWGGGRHRFPFPMWNLSFLLCLVTESIASLICFFLNSTQSTVHLDKGITLQ